ncbi:MAG: alpha/beta hydrolase family esterase [Candidatus Nanopelagicales bacterium]
MRRVALGGMALRALCLVGLLFGLLATGVSAAEAATAPKCALPDAQRLTFTSGAAVREYYIDLPAGGASALTPLMLALHPLGFDLDMMRLVTAFGPQSGSASDSAPADAAPTMPAGAASAAVAAGGQMAEANLRLAEREGFIAVFPGAINHVWDLRPDGVDTAFLGQLVSYLHAQGCGAPDRTMLSGHSMGSMMTARLLCAHPELFSGAAMVAGIYPPTPGCTLRPNTSVVGIHGTADLVVRYDGSVHPELLQYGIEPFGYDRAKMMAQWAQAKGCSHPVTSSWFITAATEYTGCPAATIQMLAVYAGGHDYNLGGWSSSEYIWSVLRPTDRAPVRSAATALHRSVGAVGSTGELPITAGSTLSIETGIANGTVLGTLTVTGPQGAGHLRAFPCDEPMPGASVLSYPTGQTVANGTAIHTGADGRICVYTASTTHVLWDQVSQSDLASHAPVRKLDSRSGAPIPPGSTVAVQTGVANATVLGTVTATRAEGAGHVRLFPCDEGLPQTSVLNFGPGATTAAGATVHTDGSGRICLYASATTHLLWDQASENGLPSHQATRILDTRQPADGARRIPAGSTLGIDTGRASGTVLGTLTAVGAAGPGHLRVYPCDQPRPEASALNVDASQNRATGVAARTSADGRICVYAAVTTYVVWDQVVESADLPSHSPVRLLDTRA